LRAGGFTEDAFLQEAYLLRPSSRIVFDKEFERLKEMRREEMSDLEYQYFVMRQNSENVERIVVDFEKLMLRNDKSHDVVLKDGDIIVIPKAPNVVTVTGSVARPGGVTYAPGQRLSYYLTKAGGASWDAKLSNTKIIKVTGEVVDDEDVKSFSAGDIIWVPRKEDKNFWPVFLQTVSVAAQLASIYLIIDTSINR
jgi:protein involved in polysaccharide export with SLBB domain